MRSETKRCEGGFTLIEILVVITIIATLMGLGVLLIGPALGQKNAAITRTRLDKIAGALTELKSPQLLGEYPPADTSLLVDLDRQKIGKMTGPPNDLNLGNESVYLTINMVGHDVSADVENDCYGNTDDDTMAQNPTRIEASSELYDYVDAWGNPFAYFSARDYKNFENVSKYVLGIQFGGETVKVVPHTLEKTGRPRNPRTFQLFSAGPDGEFNTEDDIGNW